MTELQDYLYVPTGAVSRLVVVSDLHIHYHDERSLTALSNFIVDFEPHVFVMNGDMIDCTAISNFRLPDAQRQTLELQRDLLRSQLRNWRSIMPNAEMVYIMGNHEERLAHYVVDHAPELEFLLDGALSFEQFAKLNDLGIKLLKPYGAAYDWYGLTITHGSHIVVNTAKHNLIAEGSSGVSGHTHRLSSYYKSDRGGDHAWYEGGCLCIVNSDNGGPPPDWPGVRDWQQGFTVGYAWGQRNWTVYQVPIVNHQFTFDGRLYNSSKARDEVHPRRAE